MSSSKKECIPTFRTELEETNRANERLIRAARRKIQAIAPNDVDRAAKIAAILASVSTGPNLGTTHFVDHPSGALITNDQSEDAGQKFLAARNAELDYQIECSKKGRFLYGNTDAERFQETKEALAALEPRMIVVPLPGKEPAAPKKRKAAAPRKVEAVAPVTPEPEKKAAAPAAAAPANAKRAPWELAYLTPEELEAAPAALLAFLKSAAAPKAQRRTVNRLLCLLGYRCSTGDRENALKAVKESARIAAGLLRLAARHVEVTLSKEEMKVSVAGRGETAFRLPGDKAAAFVETIKEIAAAM